MNTILTMFVIGLRVYDTWHHGFSKLAMTTCFFTYICKLFEYFSETQRYTALCDIHIGFFFFEKQAGCCFETTNLTASHGLHYF